MATISNTIFNAGDGLKFDGVNDYVNCGNILTPTDNDFTHSFIFNLQSFTVGSPISGNEVRPVLYSKGTNVPSIGGIYCQITANLIIWGITWNDLSQTSFSGLYSFQINTIYHITLVKSGYIWQLYINGNLVKNTIFTKYIIKSTTRELFLGIYEIPKMFTKGTFFDFKIYNRALTQSEITKMYNTMNQMRPDNELMLDYRFDQKSGTVLKDYSINGYNGILTNFGTTSNLGGGAWVNKYGNTITQY